MVPQKTSLKQLRWDGRLHQPNTYQSKYLVITLKVHSQVKPKMQQVFSVKSLTSVELVKVCFLVWSGLVLAPLWLTGEKRKHYSTIAVLTNCLNSVCFLLFWLQGMVMSSLWLSRPHEARSMLRSWVSTLWTGHAKVRFTLYSHMFQFVQEEKL